VSKATGNRVYQAIKARLVAYEFPQGQRIYLEPIAAELGVSTTPVREALNRLAAEDLVIKASQKGFIAMHLNRDRLRGHYELTRLLLTHELEGLNAAKRRKLPEFEPIAGVLYKLNRRAISDANTLAAYTGEIFVHIGSLGENADLIDSIGRANDHLHYIRTIECHFLQDVQNELRRLCELLLASRCKELLQAIHDYHDTRIDLLPKLLEFARR
jgi:DNA-binding GntR family transcriptional regulator